MPLQDRWPFPGIPWPFPAIALSARLGPKKPGSGTVCAVFEAFPAILPRVEKKSGSPVFHAMRAFRGAKKVPSEESPKIDVEAFYTRYGPMVLRRCRKLLSEEQAAFDATQEVFLKVLLGRGRLTGEYPSALLFRIATNTCLNRIREDRRRLPAGYAPHLRELAFGPAQESAVSAGNLLDHLFENEPEEARQIAVMYFVDGMTLKEIGAAVRLSISGVHKRLERLRRRIRAKGGRG